MSFGRMYFATSLVWIGVLVGIVVVRSDYLRPAPLPEDPGELAKTPGNGRISYHVVRTKDDWNTEPLEPWCFVVRQVVGTNPEYPLKNRANLVFAQPCGAPGLDLPLK